METYFVEISGIRQFFLHNSLFNNHSSDNLSEKVFWSIKVTKAEDRE